MENFYSKLITPQPLRLAEPPQPYLLFSERHLQALWMEQKFIKPNIQLVSGEVLEIVSPGIWNQEAGPDFKKAHLKIADKHVYGDIEVHLYEDDWWHHGHHEDDRYNQVILHVVLWQSRTEHRAMTKGRRDIACMILTDCLSIPLESISKNIDLDLYPYKKFIGSGKCAHKLFHFQSKEKIVHLFEEASLWRLRQKHIYLKSQITDQNHYMGAGVARALGYKQNSESFLDMYVWFSEKKGMDEEAMLSLALGMTGFFSKTYQTKWRLSSKYEYLKALYYMCALTEKEMPRIHLRLSHIRPFNHPVRRMAYLIKFINEHPEITSQLLSLWKGHWYSENWNFLKEKLFMLIPDYKDDYWNSHYTFEEKPKKVLLPLMGEQLKKEIVINTFLPFLLESLRNEGKASELQAFKSFYASFSATNSGKSRYLKHRFFGDSEKGNLMNRGDLEQGSYQIHHDFCVHYEASCEGCPFIQRYQEMAGATC